MTEFGLPAVGGTMLDHALMYARLGWRIFRLTGYKTPFKGSHWSIEATSDEDVIREWWPEGGGWSANIGFATGLPKKPIGGEPNIIVIDCDGPTGFEAFKRLGESHGGMPRTLVCKTRRGWHFYFRVPDGIRIKKSTAKRKASGEDGIDVQGDGAYVVVPPSVNAEGGFVYYWVNWGTDIVEMPAWLVEWCRARGALKRLGPPPELGLPARVFGAPLPAAREAGQREGSEKSGLAQRALATMKRGELPDFLAALRKIPATESYDEWFRTGAAIYDFNPGDDGLVIFKRWSATAEGYREDVDAGVCERKWEEYNKGYDGQRVTVATVYAKAREADPPPADKPTDHGVVNGHAHLPDIFKTAAAGGRARADEIIHWPDTDKDGNPRATTTNAGLAIKGLDISCSKDVFHEKMILGGHAIDTWAGSLSDDAVLMVRKIIKASYGFDPGEKNTRDAAVQLCLENQFNPVVDYLDGLVWDGIERINTWTVDYLGATDTPLNREWGRLMLVAAVRRARHPGTKFDQIVVLEGKEGTGKSSAIKILAGEDNFSDQNILAASDKEQQEAFCGVWLHEIAELAGMRRTDVERIKQFASRTEDRARPAYGRIRVDMKRRGIFIATTNEETYLKSETGNRRFWPIETGHIELEWLATDRNQLWAEAAQQEKKGVSIELRGAMRALAAEEQEKRKEEDSWFNGVVEATENARLTSVNAILTGQPFLLHLREIKQFEQNRVARALQKLGYVRFRKRVGNSLKWMYRRGDAPEEEQVGTPTC